MELQISTDKYSIISNGIIILDKPDTNLQFNMKVSDTFSFDVILKFVKSDIKDEQKVDKEVSKNTITFKCINFDNELGTGIVNPLPIATVSGKEICLHFWSYLMGNETVRKVEYTLLEEKN